MALFAWTGHIWFNISRPLHRVFIYKVGVILQSAAFLGSVRTFVCELIVTRLHCALRQMSSVICIVSLMFIVGFNISIIYAAK